MTRAKLITELDTRRIPGLTNSWPCRSDAHRHARHGHQDAARHQGHGPDLTVIDLDRRADRRPAAPLPRHHRCSPRDPARIAISRSPSIAIESALRPGRGAPCYDVIALAMGRNEGDQHGGGPGGLSVNLRYPSAARNSLTALKALRVASSHRAAESRLDGVADVSGSRPAPK